MSTEPSAFVADLTADQRGMSRYEATYAVMATTFVIFLVLTNIIGIKLFKAPFNPEFALTTGILTYPITFLMTDLVSEIYGQKRADFMVYLGFGMSVLSLILVQVALNVDPHPYWVPPTGGYFPDVEGYQRGFASVFAMNGTLLFGSMLAYMVAQLIDNRLFHFWKDLTQGRHLWLRNNGSTLISQLVDTAIVNSILFYIGFGMDFWTGVEIMVTIYLYKAALALLDTPLMYLGTWWLKRWLDGHVPGEARS